MRKPEAIAGSALFFALAPGVVAGVLPRWISGWRVAADWGWFARVPGVVLVTIGVVALVHAFAKFVMEGAGTPAPVAPTERLVVGGAYRHVRNPMYVAVVAAIVGQALLLGSVPLLWYALAALLAMAAFVRFHEEPLLERRFGGGYAEYRRNVPGWLPRLRPWRA